MRLAVLDIGSSSAHLRVVDGVPRLRTAARGQHVAELIPIATAAVRNTVNREDILDAIERRTGVRVGYLSGEEEARLTYFAAHRWG